LNRLFSRPARPSGSRPRIARQAAVAALAAACAALAACSSSGSSSAAGGSTATASAGGSTPAGTGSASSPATSTATGSTYVIGNVSSITGPYAASIGGATQVFDAWTKYTNAHGGVNGHPVKVIVLDDGSVPSKGIAAAKELIGEHVMAIVGMASNTFTSWEKLVDAAKIPVIGGQTQFGALQYTDPDLFPTGTTTPALSVVYTALTAGKKSVALPYCSEVPICSAQTTSLVGDLKSDPKLAPGVSISYQGAISASAPNYTAQCLAMEQAGASAVYVVDGAATTVRVVNDCATEGFKPTVIGSGASADNTWLTDANFSGAFVPQEDFPWFSTKTAGAATFNDALKTYDPGLLSQPTYNANDSQEWAAAQVYAAAMTRAKTGDSPTAADVTNAMYALPAGFSVAGVTPPLTYTKGKANPDDHCYFQVEVQNQQWTVPGDGAAICPSGS
jgi:branched-chain amino acid transport system substrate-binding protein